MVEEMLQSRLDTIARELDERMDTVMRIAADAGVAGAKARVPVDSGALRDAIHAERQKEGGYKVIAGDSDAYYGHIVEHGSVNTPPRPFLTPAIEALDIDGRLRKAMRET